MEPIKVNLTCVYSIYLYGVDLTNSIIWDSDHKYIQLIMESDNAIQGKKYANIFCIAFTIYTQVRLLNYISKILSVTQHT